ncbi:MAG TPA: hypothetical protein PL110_12735 [Candidatus Eremiobacteraeota bacterium]|nr:hypothetical protein [Candidatus Eremiobacteraeota bacterium]
MTEVISINDNFQEVDTKTIDGRKRLTIGNLLGGFKRVKIYKNTRGELLLKPVVEIPFSELWLYKNKEAFESVQKGLEDMEKGRISEVNPDEL